MFGPNLPRTKKNKPKRKKTKSFDGKSRKAIERRTFERQERRRKKADRLQRIADKREAKREEEKQRRKEERQRRAETGEPIVMKVKSKRDPKVHNGSEQVDSIILKVLGKSSKSKRVAGNGKQSVVRKKKVDLDTQQEAKCQDVGPDVPYKEFSNIKEFSNTKTGPMSASDKPDMTSSRWLESSSGASMERTVKKKPKRFVKRLVKKTRRPSESSDEEEDEKPKRQRRRKVFLRLADPSLTESSGAETPYLADSSEDEDGNMGTKVVGEMKGGAGETDLTNDEELTLAIQRSGENLYLDAPTIGDGNCFSRATVQQCQRAPVKLFLQSRGMTVTDFMDLKKNVAEFIRANSNTPKVENLRVNFEVGQLNNHREGMRRRSWRQYWIDMQKDARDVPDDRSWLEFWADDIFLKATALYLNLDIRIIWAGDSNRQRVTTIDGLFFQVAEGETRPTLYLGYIVDQHYQSLLPVIKDRYLPPGLAQPAVDNALKNVLRALEKSKQGTEVSIHFKILQDTGIL